MFALLFRFFGVAIPFPLADRSAVAVVVVVAVVVPCRRHFRRSQGTRRHRSRGLPRRMRPSRPLLRPPGWLYHNWPTLPSQFLRGLRPKKKRKTSSNPRMPANFPTRRQLTNVRTFKAVSTTQGRWWNNCWDVASVAPSPMAEWCADDWCASIDCTCREIAVLWRNDVVHIPSFLVVSLPPFLSLTRTHSPSTLLSSFLTERTSFWPIVWKNGSFIRAITIPIQRSHPFRNSRPGPSHKQWSLESVWSLYK